MYDYSDGRWLAFCAGLAVFWFIFAIALLHPELHLPDEDLRQGRRAGQVARLGAVYNYMVFSKLGDLSPWLILIAIGASIVLELDPGASAGSSSLAASS